MISGFSHSKVLAGGVSVFVAFFLAGLKLSFGFSLGSVALLASGLDSALDFLSSSVNLYVLYISSRPADSNHRYGHGKAEALGGLFQSVAILGSVLWLLYKTIVSTANRESFLPEATSMIIMSVSLIVTGALVLFQRTVIRKTHSLLIEADSLHYLSDLLGNLMILVSFGLAYFTGWTWLDPLAGAFVCAYLAIGCIRIFKGSLDVLMDRDFSDDYRDVLLQILEKRSAEIIGYHNLRARSAGERKFLEVHLELPKSYTLEQTHFILEEVMDELKQEFPYTEVLIHPDPVDNEGDRKILLDKESPQFY
ncbi:cation transporter [Leptospira wolffii]|uniref:cation diffusion facilitator family transporter n=1 Tax=Leptospira wolffii TaxID=409998 RepID=UPI001083DB52|nr:cation diffusion facilitator family transporter [Leptospira wolffii]TGK62092.1 cation transporter [Leptospira wolffii]TGK68694.1 cation transporter [Leptospira wolffii]TGK74522.1 cation transporter [Leptospira wolffii]TGL31902.1 cation transporter [Leptospira wolffii]